MSSDMSFVPVSLDVVIIGGGLAGLGAAYTFASTDTKYVVLEAQSYIGGRVNSKEMKTFKEQIDFAREKGLIDLGAQWLHGEQNALHQIANRHGLLTEEISEEGIGSYIREDGYEYDEFFHKKVDFEIGKILTNCESFAFNGNKSYPKSIQHYLEEEFHKYLKTVPNEEERRMANELYDWHRRFQIIDNSCLSLDQVSAKSWGMYSFNGESCQAHINFKNGFSSVVDIILREIGEEHIEVNAEVVNIDWDVKSGDQNLVSVRTACGKTYLAKQVLVTCSLGVLKARHEHIFRPLLPHRTQAAIDQMGFGTINKIFLQFDRPWWQPMQGIQLIFKEDSAYSDKKWTRHLTGFDILSPGSPNTLIGWVGSSGAIEMEKLSDEQIIEDCVEILTRFTKTQVPYPVRFDCSRWGSNEFVRGGYSYLSTKCDESGFNGTTLSTPITIKDLPKTSDLSEPLSSIAISENEGFKSNSSRNTNGHANSCRIESEERPILLFAGEACHPKYFSTAHGAFLSGIEQAQTILKYA